MNIDKLKRLTKKFVKCLGGQKEELNQFIMSNNANINLKHPESYKFLSENFKEDFMFFCFISLVNKFENILSIKDDKYIYNRLQVRIKILNQTNINVLKDSLTEKSYYLVRSLDENFSIIIAEIDQELELKKNITTEFLEIYYVFN